MPTIAEGSWQNCAWTGKCYRACDNPAITMAVKRRENGTVVPAMPPNPFVYKKHLLTLFTKIAQAPGAFNQFDKSLAFRCKIKSVPLKPKPKYFPAERHQIALISHCDSLSNMYPVGLIKENIGANIGLLRILRARLDKEEQSQEDKCQGTPRSTSTPTSSTAC